MYIEMEKHALTELDSLVDWRVRLFIILYRYMGRRPPGSQQNCGSNPMGDVNPARVVRGGQFW